MTTLKNSVYIKSYAKHKKGARKYITDFKYICE